MRLIEFMDEKCSILFDKPWSPEAARLIEDIELAIIRRGDYYGSPLRRGGGTSTIITAVIAWALLVEGYARVGVYQYDFPAIGALNIIAAVDSGDLWNLSKESVRRGKVGPAYCINSGKPFGRSLMITDAHRHLQIEHGYNSGRELGRVVNTSVEDET